MRKGSALRPLLALTILASAAAGCTRAALGEAQLRRSPSAEVRGTFEVDRGSMRSGAFWASLDAGGCVHGTYQLDEVLLLCPDGGQGDAQRWSGVGGEITVAAGSDKVHVSGYLSRSAIDPPLRRPVSVGGVIVSQPLITPVAQRIRLDTDVALGDGPPWDELRRHPVLLALAAAVAGIRE